ncbi:hypothetical protein ACWHLZ_27895 [Streptomyces chartreusis]|uniref:hypothetical protein n=1 Tax=Streptomyces chartreusis TaxID=1969 RepID=UPI0034425D48
MSPLRTLRQLVVGPTGRHRGPRAEATAERIAVPLAGLSGLPPQRFPDVPHGAIAVQAFRHCPPCGGEVAVVLHAGGAYRCGSGHLTIPTAKGES